jgi:hypothetical protein
MKDLRLMAGRAEVSSRLIRGNPGPEEALVFVSCLRQPGGIYIAPRRFERISFVGWTADVAQVEVYGRPVARAAQ